MDFLTRAKQADLVHALEAHGSLAVKLLRTYVAQAEALAKLRRGGEQTVRVEHVHVHPGGQAIVAASRTRGVGVGGENKNGEQPHSKAIAHALQRGSQDDAGATIKMRV